MLAPNRNPTPKSTPPLAMGTEIVIVLCPPKLNYSTELQACGAYNKPMETIGGCMLLWVSMHYNPPTAEAYSVH